MQDQFGIASVDDIGNEKIRSAALQQHEDVYAPHLPKESIMTEQTPAAPTPPPVKAPRLSKNGKPLGRKPKGLLQQEIDAVLRKIDDLLLQDQPNVAKSRLLQAKLDYAILRQQQARADAENSLKIALERANIQITLLTAQLEITKKRLEKYER